MDCTALLCHMPGLDQLGYSPWGTSVSAGTLDWGQWGQAPCPATSDQPKAQQVDILSHGLLAGQLQLAGWLTGWLPIEQNINLTLPQAEMFCGHVHDDFGHIDQMYPPPPGRDISWPSVLLLWADCPLVRCTPHMRLQVRFVFGQMSGQVNIMSDVPPTNWKSCLDMERWLIPWTTSTPRKTFYPGG